jgi:hypothetical protein
MAKLLKVPLPEAPAPTALDTAKNLATAAAGQTGSRWAVCVSPIHADAKGAKSVWVAYQLGRERWETQQLTLRDSGEVGRATLTTQVLDFLRQQI